MARSNEITLLIADDSEEMRETLKTLLTFNEKIRVVGEAADGKEALAKVESLKPNLVLMDINMGVMGQSDGLWATKEISLKYPQTGIIIISVQNEGDYMRQAMAAGARDYLVKPFDSDELFKTIEAVAERERAIWSSLPSSSTTVKEAGSGKVFTIFSPKGGVGKSVITSNLAVEVARRTHKRVLIVDLDLQFGDIALLLNVSPKSTIAHVAEMSTGQIDPEALELHISDSPYGVRILAAPLKPEYAEVVTPQIVKEVLSAVKGLYDYIFIDTVPNFGNEVLAAMDVSDEIFLVVAPDFLTLKNITLGLGVMDTLNYPQKHVHLILNRAQSLSAVRIKDIEKGLQRKILIEIPSDGEAVVGSINRGQPLVVSNPGSPVAKAIAELAGMIIGEENGNVNKERDEKAGKGLLGGIFGKR
ncbi:MAG: response regulator [bacterium]|nr:response regulator [bacterium]